MGRDSWTEVRRTTLVNIHRNHFDTRGNKTIVGGKTVEEFCDDNIGMCILLVESTDGSDLLLIQLQCWDSGCPGGFRLA